MGLRSLALILVAAVSLAGCAAQNTRLMRPLKRLQKLPIDTMDRLR